MSTVGQGFINRAIKIAETVDFKFRLAAILFDKQRILSVGRNDPYRRRWQLQPQYTKWEGSLHAEADAILNYGKEVKGLSLLVIRIDKFGNLMEACPCCFCFSMIDDYGLKRVVHSTCCGFKTIERKDFKKYYVGTEHLQRDTDNFQLYAQV